MSSLSLCGLVDLFFLSMSEIGVIAVVGTWQIVEVTNLYG